MNQAKYSAINEAKINALKAAGIGENIKSYQLLFSSQEKNEYAQFFSSDIQSEIQGAVASFDIITGGTSFDFSFAILVFVGNGNAGLGAGAGYDIMNYN